MQCNLSYNFDYCSVMDNLYAMSELNRYETGQETSEYYYQYEENAIEIATFAGEMWAELSDTQTYPYYPHFSSTSDMWNSVVATLDGVSNHGTLCAITGNDEMVYDPWDHEYTREKYRNKLQRLTKGQIMKLHSWVTGWLARYMDLRAAYESIYSVVSELEFNNSMLRKNNTLNVPGAVWST